jgi:acetyl esterase
MSVEVLVAARPTFAQYIATIDLPVGELAVVRDLAMPGPGPGGPIALRLFDARAKRSPGPAVIFFHGGGFILGDNDTAAHMCAEVARRLDLPVISVDYRLLPEHVWPAAADDAEAAARWIAANGAAFNLAITGLVLCGDSAGGNLTIVTAMALRDRPAAVPVLLQFPIYPVIEFGFAHESAKAYGKGYGLDTELRQWLDSLYKPQMGHWRSTPSVADQSGMPATLVLTAGLDPLRDEGRAYAAKTVAAGVPTTYLEAEGTIHGFLNLRKVIPSGQADFVAALETARLMITQRQTALRR